jgi:rhodanese-related sulfurtransferase
MLIDYSIKNITALQLKELLSGDVAPLVLDVRETEEVEICTLPTFVHIPLGNLTREWEQLSRDHVIVTVCHHGRRSLQAAIFLRSCGFEKVLNLQGGIQSWADQVDPLMAQY